VLFGSCVNPCSTTWTQPPPGADTADADIPETLSGISQPPDDETSLHGSLPFAVSRATDDSLRQRLALAHERINQLRTEN
jgi:hypothetical protein